MLLIASQGADVEQVNSFGLLSINITEELSQMSHFKDEPEESSITTRTTKTLVFLRKWEEQYGASCLETSQIVTGCAQAMNKCLFDHPEYQFYPVKLTPKHGQCKRYSNIKIKYMQLYQTKLSSFFPQVVPSHFIMETLYFWWLVYLFIEFLNFWELHKGLQL